MSMQPERVRRFLNREPAPAEVSVYWRGVQVRRHRQRRRRATVLGVSGGVAIAVVAVMASIASQPSLPPVATLAKADLELGLGVHATYASGAALHVVDANETRVDLALGQGVVELDVDRQAGRQATVRVDQHVIRLTEGKVAVSRVDKRVAVEAIEGRVEVLNYFFAPARVETLYPGEVRWYELTRPRNSEEPAPVDQAPLPPPRRRPHVERPAASTPDAVLESGRNAWRRGDFAAADLDYAFFLERFAQDPRAAWVAFELGKLRLERLHEPRGAIEALRRSLALAPMSDFAEDVQARLVEALEATGDRDACLVAREDYLRRYPTGAHGVSVERRCPR